MGKVQPFRDCSGKETDHQEIPIRASPMNCAIVRKDRKQDQGRPSLAIETERNLTKL